VICIISKIEEYLAKFASLPKSSPQEPKRIARESFIEARKNGIKTLAGFYSWAYFYYSFGGSFGHTPEMQEYLAANKGISRDALLKSMLYQNVDNLKSMKNGSVVYTCIFRRGESWGVGGE